MPITNLGEKGAWAYPGTAQMFGVPPIISVMGKATKFKFCMHIHRINQNKRPLKISAKVAVGVLKDSWKFSGHPYMGCIACMVIFAVAQLSCFTQVCSVWCLSEVWMGYHNKFRWYGMMWWYDVLHAVIGCSHWLQYGAWWNWRLGNFSWAWREQFAGRVTGSIQQRRHLCKVLIIFIAFLAICLPHHQWDVV